MEMNEKLTIIAIAYISLADELTGMAIGALLTTWSPPRLYAPDIL